MDKNNKEKFTTILTSECKYKLKILTAYNKFEYINQYIENVVEKEWKCYENEMGKKQYK